MPEAPAAGRRQRRSQLPAGYEQDPLPFEPADEVLLERKSTDLDSYLHHPAIQPIAGEGPAARPTEAEHEQAARVLWQALKESGGQQAAHAALDAARRAARDLTDTLLQQQRDQARQERDTPLPVPADHQDTLSRIEQLRAERQTLTGRQRELWACTRTLQADLDSAPRWARAQRRDLTHNLDGQREELAELQNRLLHNERTLDGANALAARQAREQRAAEVNRFRPPLADTLAALRPVIDLADPRPGPGASAAQGAGRPAPGSLRERGRAARPRFWPPQPDPRRDGPGLSR